MRRVLLAFEPPDGGVAENVAQLALGLGDQGWEVELAAPRESILDERAAAAGIPIHRLAWARGYGHPGHDYRSARQLAALSSSQTLRLAPLPLGKGGRDRTARGACRARAGRLQSALLPVHRRVRWSSSDLRHDGRTRAGTTRRADHLRVRVRASASPEDRNRRAPSRRRPERLCTLPHWRPGRRGDTQVCGRRPARCLDRGSAPAEAARRADRRGAVDPRACAGREGGGDRRWAASWRTHRARRAPGAGCRAALCILAVHLVRGSSRRDGRLRAAFLLGGARDRAPRSTRLRHPDSGDRRWRQQRGRSP